MNKENNSSTDNNSQQKESPKTDFTMAANDNPKANRNIREAPFEKKKDSEYNDNLTGSEITDGEGG